MRGPVLVMAALVLAGCVGVPRSPRSSATSEQRPTPVPTGLRHFDAGELSFDYPAVWQEARFEMVSSFSTALVFLSTASLSDPCTRTPNSIACTRLAASKLEADGIYLVWFHWGFPAWTFDPSKGTPQAVGGRPATLERLDPTPSCRAIGGERELLVTVDNPTAQWNWNELQACLRGPALDVLEGQIDAMFATVHWRP